MEQQFAAVLDFETTGFEPTKGQIIEGAVALVEIRGDQTFGETVDSYASFNDPGMEIPPEIVRLTGITDADVEGKKLDWERFNAILARAQVLIAHNATFDRPWLELHGGFKTPNWGCSVRNIAWSDLHGMPCRTLKHLAWEHDLFPKSHRAMDDVESVVYLLRQPGKGTPSRSYGQELMQSIGETRRLIMATGAPFASKDLLKGRQFRWSPEKRVWWKIVPEGEISELKGFLDEAVYGGLPRYQVSDPIDPLDPGFKSRYGLG